jgi:hypothetical protein
MRPATRGRFGRIRLLNRVPRFGEGEPPGEPFSNQARLEPRPPKITQRPLVIAISLACFGAQSCVETDARQIAIGPPSSQADAATSYDTDLLNRLTMTGQFQPEDLARLARLTVLQALAMQADIQRASPGSITGGQLEADIATLRNAADSFYEDVRSTGTDETDPDRQRLLYYQMQVAYRQLDSALSQFPGVSTRATMRLQDVGRMIDLTSNIMSAIEAGEPGPVVPPLNQTLDLPTLKRQSRLAANSLVRLIQEARLQKPRSPGDDPVPALEELWTSLHEFNRSLDLEPSFAEAETALRAIRRQANRLESRLSRLAWPALQLASWRSARASIKELADDFGMPRTLDRSLPPDPQGEGTRTRIYRGPS